MGEAWLDQGDLKRAREWLGAGAFAKGTEVQGLRMLARLDYIKRARVLVCVGAPGL